MAWRLPGDKPLSEPMMISLLTHICVTRPQWVNKRLAVQYCFSVIKISQWTALWEYHCCRQNMTFVLEFVGTCGRWTHVDTEQLYPKKGREISQDFADHFQWRVLVRTSVTKSFIPNESMAETYIDDLVQDCSNSISNALEWMQSCTKPSI